MKIQIANFLTLLILLFATVSCDSKDTFKVQLEKNGNPMVGVTVSYTESNNKLGSNDYSGVTDSSGTVEFQVNRSQAPLLYSASVKGENSGNAIVSGGFRGSKRVGQWIEDGYRVTFDE